MRIKLAGITDVGLVRTTNEDCFGFSGSAAVQGDRERFDVEASAPLLAVIADGLGGHNRGDVASRTAVHAVLAASPDDLTSLVESIASANDAVRLAAASTPELDGMATTIVAALVLPDRLIIANVGDSRAYITCPGSPLTQLTVDDVPAGPSSLPGDVGSALTQSLGSGAAITVHSTEIELDGALRLMLCSDGLSSYVPHVEMSDAARLAEPGAAATELVEAAHRSGGRDNVTVIVADLIG